MAGKRWGPLVYLADRPFTRLPECSVAIWLERSWSLPAHTYRVLWRLVSN
jgi:hypothetical protein